MIRLDDLVTSETRRASKVDPTIVEFHHSSFAWKKPGPAILKDLDAEIKANRITAILGDTGSGKSTFLESILGETVALDGQTERDFPAVAYCTQVPWLVSGTVRDNILGGSGRESNVNEIWYSAVIQACGLEADFARLTAGDQTLVGSKGVNLSGGQRQRIVSSRRCILCCSFSSSGLFCLFD